MDNTERMKEDICNDSFMFVYSLLDNGIIFYIGCTHNLVRRYTSHIATAYKSATATAKRIKSIIEQGRWPDMKIINRLPAKEAIKLETILIASLTSGGQQLTNATLNKNCNWRTDKEGHDPKTRKEMINVIKRRQISCAQFYTNNNADYNRWKVIRLEYR